MNEVENIYAMNQFIGERNIGTWESVQNNAEWLVSICTGKWGLTE